MPAMIRCLTFAFLTLMVGGSPVLAQNAPESKALKPPVLLELFTSQGCSFCPPADELMGQMIQQDGIIGLSCHVDYFAVRQNPLGKSFCTQRQAQYNRRIGKGPRYTPQLVVNGQSEMIGYQTGKVSAAILKARAARIFSIPVVSESGAVQFSLPSHDLETNAANIWLAVYNNPYDMTVLEGQNFARKITYHNVVSRMEDLGPWDGEAVSRRLELILDTKEKGVAVFVQDTASGAIIGAGQAVGR